MHWNGWMRSSTLIIVNNVEGVGGSSCAERSDRLWGTKVLGTGWYGGNYFQKQHVLFDGLPRAQVFSGIPVFATYNKTRLGLRLLMEKPLWRLCVADLKKSVFGVKCHSAGRGKIILCALDIYSCLKDIAIGKKARKVMENASMNTFNISQKNKANVVGQQLLLNFLRFK